MLTGSQIASPATWSRDSRPVARRFFRLLKHGCIWLLPFCCFFLNSESFCYPHHAYAIPYADDPEIVEKKVTISQ
jgi:hypothetical protein